MDIAGFSNNGYNCFLFIWYKKHTLFKKPRNITHTAPITIVADGLNIYHMSLMLVYPKSKYPVYNSFRDDVSNHVIESFHKTFKACYKTKKGFHCLGYDFQFFCSIIILSIAIVICSDTHLPMLQMLHILKSK